MKDEWGRRSRGFSLIEVMISLVVVSLGLGGILLSQARSVAATHSGGYRLQANLLAQQILDRARANPGQRYDGSAKGVPATDDLAQWQMALQTTLPGGRGTITHTPVNGAQSIYSTTRVYERLTVSITWNDKRVSEYGGGGVPTTLGVRSDDPSSSEANYTLEGYRVLP